MLREGITEMHWYRAVLSLMCSHSLLVTWIPGLPAQTIVSESPSSTPLSCEDYLEPFFAFSLLNVLYSTVWLLQHHKILLISK